MVLPYQAAYKPHNNENQTFLALKMKKLEKKFKFDEFSPKIA